MASESSPLFACDRTLIWRWCTDLYESSAHEVCIWNLRTPVRFFIAVSAIFCPVSCAIAVPPCPMPPYLCPSSLGHPDPP